MMADKEIKKVSSWDDRHDTIKIIKSYDPKLSWTHLVLGMRKEDGKPVLRLKKIQKLV